MLQAFRLVTIEIEPIKGDEPLRITIPFDVELLERVEDTLQKLGEPGWNWFRMKRRDRSVLTVYEDFCRPYLTGIDFKKVQPTFCALFFSSVRAELLASINAFISFTSYTEMPPKPTEEKTAETA